MGFTTLNPADNVAYDGVTAPTSPGGTLSNGNLWWAGLGAAFKWCRGIQGQSTGKHYYEADNSDNAQFHLFQCYGLMLGPPFLQTDTINTGFIGNTPNNGIYNNGVNIPMTLQGGHAINGGVAVDLDHRMAWFRNGAGNWNNSGTANPATNVGGIDISPIFPAGTTVYPVVTGAPFAQLGSWQVNFGASAFHQTPPAGFESGWPDTLPTVFSLLMWNLKKSWPPYQ